MRTQFTNTLNQTFHAHLVRNRAALGISQEEMARRLSMASRTYVDLDHGKSGCSALTLALFLLHICPDSEEFLQDLRHALEKTL